MANKRGLCADWETQTGLLISWPHQTQHRDIDAALLTVVEHISPTQPVLIACHNAELIGDLAINLGVIPGDLRFYHAPNNSPWVRDYGPLSCHRNDSIDFLDFQFTGWGKQAEHDLDNRLTAQLDEQCVFQSNLIYRNFVLEGGSLSSDGQGTLLGDSNSLYDIKRNGDYQPNEVESYLLQNTQAQRLLTVNNIAQSFAHAQALRFVNTATLVVSVCSNPQDDFYLSLQELHKQTQQLRNSDDSSYQIVELPLPQPIRINDQPALPAFYTDYLLTNEHIFVPQFGDDNDQQALDTLQNLYPERKAIAVDALPLLKAGGNLRAACLNLHGQITY